MEIKEKILKLETELRVFKKGKELDKEILNFLQKKKKVICRGLNKRPVFLEKYLEITNGRKDRTRRKEKFYPALELIKKVEKENLTNRSKDYDGNFSFEFKGTTKSGKEVGVHIREETENGNKKLYLISTF